MKILLVVKSKQIETLGPMYLSAVIKQCGHDAKICDITEAPMVAAAWRPDAIGYSLMTGDRERFMELNEALKKRLSFVSIVGGPDVTFFPRGYEWADHVVIGEGETWMAKFLGAKKRYPDLDSIPYPDRTDFLDMPIRDFMASRGCPYSTCKYCSQTSLMKCYPDLPKVRLRSVDNVIAEVKSVGGRFNYFQDSAFGYNRKWLLEFCDKYWIAIKTPFHVHLRPSQADVETISHLAMAGCYSLRFALETSSNRLRKLIGRAKTNDEEAYEASRLCRKYHIKFMVQNILSLPTSTIEDDLATLETNIRCRPDYSWSSIFSPFPGTDLGDLCVSKGWFDGDYSKISDSFFDRSVLNFSEEYKEQTYFLQKCFALAVETQTMPKVEELTAEQFPMLVHRMARRLGDKRIYNNIL